MEDDSWIENRILCGFIILILSLFALLANLSICLYHRLPNNTPILSLAISSIIYQITNIVVYVPCSFTGCSFYSYFMLEILSVSNTICYNVCHLCFTHLSIERMLVFYTDNGHKLFQKLAIVATIFVWIYVIILATVGSILGCVKTFDVPTLRFYYNIDAGGAYFANIYLGHSVAFTLIMIICYVMIFIKIRMLINQLGHKQKEIKLAFQYFFICAFAWFSIFFFFFIAKIQIWFNVKLSIWPSLVSTVSSSSHCYVFLMFNQKLRQSIFKVIMATSVKTSTNQIRSSGGNNSSRFFS